MAKIGIFGGSFNPIHLGHIGICRDILEKKMVDEIWLMVSPQNPLKPSSGLIDEGLRLKLAKEATKSIKNIKVSDFEFSLPRPSYTYDTLSRLSVEYPKDSFSLIIGADNWYNFKKWYRYSEILMNYNIIVFPRKDFPLKSENVYKHPNVTFLDSKIFPFSSTEVRAYLSQGKSIENIVPQEITNELLHMYPNTAST